MGMLGHPHYLDGRGTQWLGEREMRVQHRLNPRSLATKGRKVDTQPKRMSALTNTGRSEAPSTPSLNGSRRPGADGQNQAASLARLPRRSRENAADHQAHWLAHDMPAGLPTRKIVHGLTIETGTLLEFDLHQLAVPFGQLCLDISLDCVARVRV